MKKVEGVVAQTAAEKAKEGIFNAVANGDSTAVRKFVRNGGDVNMVLQGESILGIAVKKGRTNIVKLLLKNGANPLQEDIYGVSVLQNALQDGNYKIAIILIDELIANNGYYSLKSSLISLNGNGKLVEFVDAVTVSENPVAASVLSGLLLMINQLGFTGAGVSMDEIDAGNHAMQNCILNVFKEGEFEEYSESLKAAQSKLESCDGLGLELVKYGDAMISGRDFRDTVDDVAANIYFKVKDSVLGLSDISSDGDVVNEQKVRDFSKAVAMNAVALLYDYEDRIGKITERVEGFLADNPDAEKAKVFLEDLSQDMNLDFDIDISHLRAGTNDWLDGILSVTRVPFALESAIGTLKEFQLSSSEDLARSMIENALGVKIEGVAELAVVASEFSAAGGDLPVVAPAAADAARDSGVRVNRAGEGGEIRPGTVVGNPSAQFLGYSGVATAGSGHFLPESSAPAGPVISLPEDDGVVVEGGSFSFNFSLLEEYSRALRSVVVTQRAGVEGHDLAQSALGGDEVDLSGNESGPEYIDFPGSAPRGPQGEDLERGGRGAGSNRGGHSGGK